MKHLVSSLIALGTLLALSACAGLKPTTAELTEESEFSTRDAVLAVQLSTSPLAFQDQPTQDRGFMVLSGADGKVRVFNSEKMFGAQPLWTHNGLFYGGPADEFVTTDQGTKRLTREIQPRGEFARYEMSERDGFISFYNLGSDPEGYQQPIVVGNSEGNETFDVRGVYMTMGTCGDTLYALSDTKFSPNLADQALRVFEESQGTAAGTHRSDQIFDVFVQVYPAEDPQDPKVLAAVEHDDNISGGGREMHCLQDTVYIPFFQRDHPDAQPGDGKDPKAGHAALQTWDLAAGTRSTIPLIHEDGRYIEVTEDEMSGIDGILIDGNYHFVTFAGQVYSVDLPTGLSEHLHTFEKPDNAGNIPFYEVTQNAVYRLDDGKNDRADLDFSRYVFKTGEQQHLFDVESLSAYRTGDTFIQGIAVNPEWDSRLQ